MRPIIRVVSCSFVDRCINQQNDPRNYTNSHQYCPAEGLHLVFFRHLSAVAVEIQLVVKGLEADAEQLGGASFIV